MKTEGVTQRGDVTTFTSECDVFQDDLERGERTCSMQLRDNDGLSRPICVDIEAGSWGDTDEEGIKEGTMNVASENSREILESEKERNGRETTEVDEEYLYVDCGRTPPVVKQDQATHYAKILTTKPCASTISMARRTRESSNPILCLRYGEQDVFREDNPRNGIEGEDHTTMNENASKQRSPRKIHFTCSESEIFYINTTNGLTAKPDDNAHVYANFDHDQQRRFVQTSASNETSDTESLYEDIEDIYEAMTPPRCTSNPIGIVYASMDFSGTSNTSPSSVGSCSLSSSIGSLETRSDRYATYSSGSLSRSSEKPPELPQRTSGSLSRMPRPRSVHSGNHHDIAEFGLYTGTLVGKCTVAKSSPKSIQHVVGDFLAREKKERSKPVSLEVSGEFLRLSLNCAPWSLLAQSTLDDVGCVTTVSANNKTALGYTVGKPGEDTHCYILHCSDADAIKNAILSTFKRPNPTISRWSSMCSLGTPKSMTLPSNARLRSTRFRQNNVAISDDLVYLGSYKAKKSYLVVNDNIAAVLDHTDSKHYKFAKVELYKDAIHLKDSKTDSILDIHQLEWILSMGLFDEDRRYFGYISSKAFQGSKTRTCCHVFRCNRVGRASGILETIRHACQSTFLARRPENSLERRFRTNSSTSSSSEGSMSSNSETTSMGSAGSSPPEVDGKPDLRPPVKHRLRRLGQKARARMSTIMSFAEDDTTGDILEEKEEPEVAKKATEPRRYSVSYLCSTIVSPPLKPHHVKQCLKQYQKAMEKAMKKSTNVQHNTKVQLMVDQNGVMIIDDPSKPPQAFFERATLSSVHKHPEGKCAFAFSTIVSGNTKHKCHLFLQDTEPMDEIINDIQLQIQQK